MSINHFLFDPEIYRIEFTSKDLVNLLAKFTNLGGKKRNSLNLSTKIKTIKTL